MSRRDIAFVAGVRGVVTAVAGTLVALLTAVVLSGRFPVGPAASRGGPSGLAH